MMADVDSYDQSAEFYDVMAMPHWGIKREVLATTLKAAGVIRQPIVDIGAGTGLSTVTIADTVPDVAIHAVEPSTAMRSALVSRVLDRGSDVADRVTVHPEAIEDFQLPDSLGAAVLCGVIGHLDKPARHRLWDKLRARVAPGAPVVIEIMALDQPAVVPEVTVAQRRIGNRDNEVRISGEPAGDDAQLWTMHYVVRENGEVVRDFTASHTWYTVGLAELAGEAEAHNMTFEELHPLIGVARLQ